MATISTALRLTDNMSSVLSRVIDRMNDTNRAAQGVKTQVERMGSSSGTDRMRQSVERTSTAFQNTAKQIQNCTNHQNNFVNKLREGSTAADGLWDKVKGIALTYLSLQGVKDVLNLSDSLSNTSARLNMINDGSQTLAQLQDKIYQAAQRSRSGYLDMADAVGKMVLRTGDLFKSNDEAIAFTETLNKMYAVAGASQEEQYSATLQLTQALGSGVLRGEEFNAVFEAAPNVMQAVADYINVPIGKLRDMASEGQLSATVVKNALLAAMDETNKKFEQMPITFAQVWDMFKSFALRAFQPVLQKIGQLTKTEQFQNFVNQAAGLVAQLADVALQVFDVIMQVTNFIAQNWTTIGPVLEGIVVGLLAWKAAQALVNAVTEANPAVMIFAAAAGVIGYLVGKVGGLSNALTLAAMVVEYLGNDFQFVGMVIYDVFATATGYVEDFLVSVFVKSQEIGRDIENFFLGVYISVANGFQKFLDWFVDRINDLIGLLNKIPGVNIEQVGRLTFGENDAKWANQRISQNNEYIDTLEGVANNLKTTHTMEYYQRQWDKANQFDKTDNLRKKIIETYNKMKDETEKSSGKKAANDIFKNIPADYSKVSTPPFDPSMLGEDDDDKKARKSTAKNTKKTADAVSKSAEDLRYLRDYAFRQIIQRETTLSPSLNTNVYIQKVNSERDLDGVANYLNDKIFSAMQSSAEGVHTA